MSYLYLHDYSKPMKKLSLILSAAMLLLFAACEKKTKTPSDPGDPNVTGKTNQQIFMIQPWTMSSWVDSSSAGVVNNMESCNLDDYYTFKTTTSYEVNQGSNVCAGSPQTQNNPWAMSSASANQVTMFTWVWDIVTITGGKIVITNKQFDNTLSDYRYSTVTFVRKK
ncbi:MAG: hypothetical protein JNL57_10220 [Bacteroidetes bacterium]|nr:hypothetical protein [Bacteroidota bacterium]